MEPKYLLLLLLLLIFLTSLVSCKQTYIVYMDPAHKPSAHLTHADWYAAYLQSLGIHPDDHLLLYSYSAAAHGFAAVLLPSHLPLLLSHPAVLHVHPDPLLLPLTTRSPLFLGLPPWPPASSFAAGNSTGASGDVIVGVLDTGVWPESPSFDDAGMSDVPSRWRGACESAADFPSSLCNRKLVGASSFGRGHLAAVAAAGDEPQDDVASPRDRDGHGTHTASTAAGAPVANASFLGYAPGVARGMAPGARVAAYKVCWRNGCYGSDILAGIDKAIEDGVDVISISLGGGSAPFSRDPVAVGAFSAVQRGIFVACSAGNSGPSRATLTNTAPWIATVGAGTLDRNFPAYVQLGNGQRYTGVSLYSGGGTSNKMLPLVYGNGVQNGNKSSKLCLPGSLDTAEVKGKVVFCDRGIIARVEKGEVVKEAGGVGMILANAAANGEELVADSHLLPAVAVGVKDGDMIKKYMQSNAKAEAEAMLSFGGTVLDVRPSPVVAAFSSRGPNRVVPQLLKPDMIGPGVNILAGWSGSVGPTGLAKDGRRSAFNIMSGTSMSCPHISGVAAMLKAAHPDWSPSAIKSALMTTAYTVDKSGSPLIDAAGSSIATPLAYGSGHVDPQKALSPGLIYDITTEDYAAFLCSLEYSTKHIQAISKSSTCTRRLSDPGDLNYPSFSVVFSGKTRQSVKYTRELTNVGLPGSVYNAEVKGPSNVSVSLKPRKLVFNGVGQKLKYTVTFTSKNGGGSSEVTFGWIVWSNEQHQVQSPISYSWQLYGN